VGENTDVLQVCSLWEEARVTSHFDVAVSLDLLGAFLAEILDLKLSPLQRMALYLAFQVSWEILGLEMAFPVHTDP